MTEATQQASTHHRQKAVGGQEIWGSEVALCIIQLKEEVGSSDSGSWQCLSLPGAVQSPPTELKVEILSSLFSPGENDLLIGFGCSASYPHRVPPCSVAFGLSLVSAPFCEMTPLHPNWPKVEKPGASCWLANLSPHLVYESSTQLHPGRRSRTVFFERKKPKRSLIGVPIFILLSRKLKGLRSSFLVLNLIGWALGFPGHTAKQFS